MNCPNCGKELNEDAKFCPDCGSKIDKKTKKKEEKKEVVETTPVEKQYWKGMPNDKFLCIISLICMYGTSIVGALLAWIGRAAPILDGLTSILTSLLGLGPIAAWVLVIYAKVHYKESKFAKVLLIIYIVQTVLAIIGIIILILACVSVVDNLGSGCGSFFEELSEIGLLIK